MAATLQKIASRSGVSVNTVSNVLNGRNREVYPSAARRAERIRRIAAEMGYRPNVAARTTRSGRFGAIALLVSTEPNRSTLPDGLLRGILDGLHAYDMQLMITRLPDQTLTSEGFIPKVLSHSMSDGLLVNYTDHIPPKMTALIHEHHVPAIWLNAPVERDGVLPDDIDAGRRATEHLLDLGHRRILFACYSDSAHHSARDRYAGYAQAMAAAGLTPCQVGHVGDEGQRLARTRVILSEADRPTAVVSYGGRTSTAFFEVASELGWRLPRDLSLIHFGGLPIVRLGRLTCTTMVVPEEQMGVKAVELMMQKIAAPTQVLDACRIPFRLMPGETTSPADHQT